MREQDQSFVMKHAASNNTLATQSNHPSITPQKSINNSLTFSTADANNWLPLDTPTPLVVDIPTPLVGDVPSPLVVPVPLAGEPGALADGVMVVMEDTEGWWRTIEAEHSCIAPSR